MIRLNKYLTQSGESQRVFADRAGLKQTTVSAVAGGRMNLTVRTIRKIDVATEGEVTAQALYDHWVETQTRMPATQREAGGAVAAE